KMEERFLGGRIAVEEPAIRRKMRQAGRVEIAERGIRGRQQQRPVVEANRAIAGAAMRQLPVVERLAGPRDQIARRVDLVRRRHRGASPASAARARAKKSGPPKLPDLSASATR